MPPLVLLVQSRVINPSSTITSTSAARDRAAMSASNPPMMFWAWVVLPAYDSWNTTFWPLCSCFHLAWKAGMIFP